MRKSQVIKGFNNSQKIRVIVEGVGIYMTVGEIVTRFATTPHYQAVEQTLHLMALHLKAGEKCGGIGHRIRVYDYNMNPHSVDVQVDLL
jgi:hypothetical protein